MILPRLHQSHHPLTSASVYHCMMLQGARPQQVKCGLALLPYLVLGAGEEAVEVPHHGQRPAHLAGPELAVASGRPDQASNSVDTLALIDEDWGEGPVHPSMEKYMRIAVFRKSQLTPVHQVSQARNRCLVSDIPE